MSIFGGMGKGLMEKLGDGQNGRLIGAVASLMSSGRIGGLSGLAQLFRQKGHGDKVESWVSTGENRPISPDEVKETLGQDNVKEIASEAGMSEQEASQELSSALPKLIDTMTPEGKLPDNHSANASLSQIADRFLRH